MAVGSIEPQFYEQLMMGLGLTDEDKYIPQFGDFEESKAKLSEIFSSKTRAEWTELFDKLDACVTPILELEEAPTHPLNKSRDTFVSNPHSGRFDPTPAPRLSRTPGKANVDSPDPEIGQHTIEVLKEVGMDSKLIGQYIEDGVITTSELNSKL